ncbi:MAG: hypothetical protein RLZ12_360 [Bacillota bacterium]|jgi:hypothetical protein
MLQKLFIVGSLVLCSTYITTTNTLACDKDNEQQCVESQVGTEELQQEKNLRQRVGEQVAPDELRCISNEDQPAVHKVQQFEPTRKEKLPKKQEKKSMNVAKRDTLPSTGSEVRGWIMGAISCAAIGFSRLVSRKRFKKGSVA